jgi:hypothetical protein
MKAISIKPHFAHQILCGTKTTEYRTWQTKHRGDLLICSSAAPKEKGTISGHALIVCRLAAVEPLSKRELKQIGIDEQPEKPIYGWRLTDFRTIKPFPVKGKLNLFNVDDNLIEYIDEEHMTGKELDETFNRCFKPLFD